MTRKQLLETGASAALLSSVAAATASCAASEPRFQFDRARFADILAKPAQHRQCCASAKTAGGAVLSAMLATLYAYEYDLNEGAGTVHEVAVLYHPSGVMLGLDDAIWNEFLIPALPHLSTTMRADLTFDGTPAAHGGNPFLHRERNTALEDDSSIEALVSRGSHLFVCNNALSGLSGTLANALHRTEADVYARLLGGLVPGAMAVPAGVMAINACQEAHFTYLQATL
jgi:intracellular sulfur oxidation DsrE/DsrF family protein